LATEEAIEGRQKPQTLDSAAELEDLVSNSMWLPLVGLVLCDHPLYIYFRL